MWKPYLPNSIDPVFWDLYSPLFGFLPTFFKRFVCLFSENAQNLLWINSFLFRYWTKKHKQYSFYFIGNNAKLYCRLEVVLCLYYSVFFIRHVAWFTAKFGRNGWGMFVVCWMSAMFQNKCVLSVRMEIFIYSMWNIYEYSFGLNFFSVYSFFRMDFFLKLRLFLVTF